MSLSCWSSVWPCLAVIVLSAWLNVALRIRFPMTQRLEPDRAAAESAYAVDQMRTNALVGAASAVLAVIGLVFAGVALLLCGALPVEDMPAAWLLVAVPALPLLAAIGGALWLKSRPPTPSFSRLREQRERDTGLMQEARAT